MYNPVQPAMQKMSGATFGDAVSNTSMAAVIVVLLAVALIAMVAVASVKNARAIKRDVEQRFSKLDERLESDANSLVDHLLDRER
jgi:hypothetical protein